jgi:hypothetical protein
MSGVGVAVDFGVEVPANLMLWFGQVRAVFRDVTTGTVFTPRGASS